MNFPFFRILAAASASLLSGCIQSGATGGSTNPSAPRVQVPVESTLRPVERALLPEFEEALRDAGFATVKTPAEFQATFNINEGPINAETRMDLNRQGQSMAYATGRQGGLTKVLRGSQFAEQSFFQCLQNFEAQLSRINVKAMNTGWQGNSRANRYGGGYDHAAGASTGFGASNRYGSGGAEEPDWRSGWGR